MVRQQQQQLRCSSGKYKYTAQYGDDDDDVDEEDSRRYSTHLKIRLLINKMLCLSLSLEVDQTQDEKFKIRFMREAKFSLVHNRTECHFRTKLQ